MVNTIKGEMEKQESQINHKLRSELVRLIKHSVPNLNFFYPFMEQYGSLDENYNFRITQKHYLQGSSMVSPLTDSALLSSLLLFPLLDLHINSKHKEIKCFSNKSFTAKVSCMNSTSIEDKISKNVYRVLRIIRNAVVHDLNSVEEVGSINYKFETDINDETVRKTIDTREIRIKVPKAKKYEELKMKVTNLTYIKNIVWLLTQETDFNGFSKLIIIHLYNEIINGISSFEDLAGHDLDKVDCNIKFKSLQRLILINAEITKTPNNTLMIKQKIFKDGVTSPYRFDYYYIENNTNKKYLIPYEALDPNKETCELVDYGRFEVSEWYYKQRLQEFGL